MYIDPNTGGMLFQILAVLFGTISGGILFFSGRIRQIIARYRRRRRGETVEDDDPVEENQTTAE
jgi:hypothetical protein